MSTPGDNLPRPATPGPWYAAQSLEVPLVLTKRDSALLCTVHPYAASPDVWGADDDALAIAALPEWIAAHDAEREGRLRAEARERALEEALGEALEAAREPRADKALAAVWADALSAASFDGKDAQGVRFQARITLRVLSRHGFGGGS